MKYLLCLLVWCLPWVNRNIAQPKHYASDVAWQQGKVATILYDLHTDSTLFCLDADKKMNPASNVKILTNYLAHKYLPDTLVRFYYAFSKDTLHILPTGDPTFLHPNFDNRTVLHFFRKLPPKVKYIQILTYQWRDLPFAKGWIWDDYPYYFMAENSPMPAYGNVLWFKWAPTQHGKPRRHKPTHRIMFEPNLRPFTTFVPNYAIVTNTKGFFTVKRRWEVNVFYLEKYKSPFRPMQVPVKLKGMAFVSYVLRNISGRQVLVSQRTVKTTRFIPFYGHRRQSSLRYMMANSDNFFAEQYLLMMSARQLGYMNRDSIIEWLYMREFASPTDTFVWADGSGLSVYNLISPRQIVKILQKTYQTMGIQQIRQTFSTADEGTLQGYYLPYRNRIFLKTGSMSNVFCLSGFYQNPANHHWIAFSIMTSGIVLPAAQLKREVEAFVSRLFTQQLSSNAPH